MQHYPKKRRTGNLALLLGVLLAVVAVAGVGYFLLEALRSQPSGGNAQTVSPPKPSATAERQSESATVETRAPGRTAQILTCTDANGEVFYTNAERCDEADLENRVNVVSEPENPAQRPRNCLGAQAGGVALQRFLPVCREPFEAALELEPLLLRLDAVSESRTLSRYCAYITEGVQAGCMATSAQFCFLPRCQALREPLEP